MPASILCFDRFILQPNPIEAVCLWLRSIHSSLDEDFSNEHIWTFRKISYCVSMNTFMRKQQWADISISIRKFHEFKLLSTELQRSWTNALQSSQIDLISSHNLSATNFRSMHVKTYKLDWSFVIARKFYCWQASLHTRSRHIINLLWLRYGSAALSLTSSLHCGRMLRISIILPCRVVSLVLRSGDIAHTIKK